MQHEPLIEQIVAQYELGQPHITFLGSFWNTTYRLTAVDGESYTLRVCNPRFQDRRCLQDELVFVDAVAKRGQVQVPQPVQNHSNEFVSVVSTSTGDQLSCLFTWIEGQEAKGRLTPPVLHKMGQNVAFLHEAAQSYAFPSEGDGFREDYCYDETLVRSHRQWVAEHAAEIGCAQVALLNTAIDYVLAVLVDIGKRWENYGFIHADLHLGNFIVQGQDVSVIDFDQMGRGHFHYDIATLMVELQREPETFSKRWECFKAGYQTVRVQPFPDIQTLGPFAIAVDLAYVDWYYNSSTPAARAKYRYRLQATYASIRSRLKET